MKKLWITGTVVIAALAMALVMVGVRGASAEASAALARQSVLAPAATLVVTSTADSGAGTLRQVMQDAVNGDMITFDTTVFPPTNPATITVNTQLPNFVVGNVTVDASNAGVIVDGSGTPPGDDGFFITSNGNTIKGLQILNFGGDGVVIKDGAQNNTIGGDRTVGAGPAGEGNVISGNGHGVRIEGSGTMSNTIIGNYIGTDVSGTAAISNTNHGIVIRNGAQHNHIGGGSGGERNVISGNGEDGVRIEGSGTTSNTVSGNYIGTDASGTMAIPNDYGIAILDGASRNLVGGDTTGERNVISGNRNDGVWIGGSGTASNVVSGNYIGTNIAGTAPVSNHVGIYIADGPQRNAIRDNLISGNGDDGVIVTESGTVSNTLSGNIIGADASGSYSLGNAGSGIWLGNGASHNTIGGDTPEQRNLISGNNLSGMTIGGSGTASNVVSGNYIGTNIAGTTPISNHAGICIANGPQRNAIRDNLISGNGDDGVIVTESGTVSNTLSGNIIGADASGSYSLGNAGTGIWLGNGASYNTIGGDTPEERNLISGNNLSGIIIEGSGTVSNVISGNFFGTNISGTAAIHDGNSSVWINDGAQRTLIGGINDVPGGVCSGECNLIAGGVGIQGSSAMYNTVSGNVIGADASGSYSLGNAGTGIWLGNGASHNTIGGDSGGERNVISGNGDDGVRIEGSGTASNTVSGNYIGTDVSGTAVISNAGNGVYIRDGASHNLIGGSNATPGGACSGECNLISGNNRTWAVGVRIEGSGAMSNTVSGNYIGTDVNGTAVLGNDYGGVRIEEGAQYNVIGGDTPGERNLISGNGEEGPPPPRSGVCIYNADHNTVIGNYIGTNVTGTVSLPNKPGISMDGHYNHIAQNLISGNAWGGLFIGGMHNTVSGNIIGTDATGMVALGNEGWGIKIENASSHNVIGGSNGTPGGACSGECNLISGNSAGGVWIRHSGTTSNTVSGNYVGTDVSGTTVISNAEDGVHISEGATYNLIGGDTAWERNLISGNGHSGVFINSSGTMSNTLSGNFIGTDVGGMAGLGNGYHGVQIYGAAQRNTIGGTGGGERNVISANSFCGVVIWGTGTGQNTIGGNTIGTDASGGGALGNGYCGAYIGGGAQQNVVGPGNTVAYNDGTGVIVAGTTTLFNTITQNPIHSNAGLGIDNIDGGNTELPPPVITGIAGTTVTGQACANCTVEVFSDDDDEGRWFHGSTTADATGHFTFTAATPFTGTTVTVTATDGDGNTSEFSPPPSISHIAPNQGTNDVPNQVNVYGLNFAQGVSVTLATTPPIDLTVVRLSSSHLRATVPVSLTAGTYDLTVTNPDGRSDTLADAYTVFDAQVENDDLYAQSHDLWSDPLTIRHGEQANLGLVVHRQGGKTTLSSVTVRFYDGDPDSGGTAIGDGTVYLLSPRSSESTTNVPWSPATAGNYAIYARIDPDGAVTETVETNNTVSTTIAVLPPAGDTTPPVVTSFTINSGAEMTDVPTVTLTVSAADNVGGSGIGSIFFVEFEFVQAAMQWVPVQASGWMSYTTNYTWTLMPSAGIRYVQAWAADRAGNISSYPYKDRINYLLPSDQVAGGQVRLYRQYVGAGQTLTVIVVPISGDPDLYVWPPTEGAPAWVSNNSTGVDQLNIVATESGTYQIEVYGYSAAEYTISISVSGGGAGLAAEQKAIQSVNNDKPSRPPVIPVSNEPPGQMAMPSAPVTGDTRKVYLPLVTRQAP